MAHLLAATTKVVVATGVLNVWMHDAAETAAQHARLTAMYGPRFLAGIGIGHRQHVDAMVAEGTYTTPLARTTAYLDGLDAAAALPR